MAHDVAAVFVVVPTIAVSDVAEISAIAVEDIVRTRMCTETEAWRCLAEHPVEPTNTIGSRIVEYAQRRTMGPTWRSC